MSLQNKFDFLKTVKMPTQTDFRNCLIEYFDYKVILSDAGKYGYFVLYHCDDMKEDYNKLDLTLFTQKSADLMSTLTQLKQKHKIDFENDDFFHIRIGESKAVTTECRLYLRILPHNIHNLASVLTKKCLERNLPTHFKFTTLRLDSLVLYTDYDHAQNFVDIIEEIRQEQPSLFENAQKLHPLWGQINGYIGFMEEPVMRVPLNESYPSIGYLAKSANTYRTRLLDEMANFYIKLHKRPDFVTTKFIKSFSSKLDIDPSYYPLNASSVNSLKTAGFNVELIGSKSMDINQHKSLL